MYIYIVYDLPARLTFIPDIELCQPVLVHTTRSNINSELQVSCRKWLASHKPHTTTTCLQQHLVTVIVVCLMVKISTEHARSNKSARNMCAVTNTYFIPYTVIVNLLRRGQSFQLNFRIVQTSYNNCADQL